MMEHWITPATPAEQNALAEGMTSALETYYQKRDTPAPASPTPAPVIDPAPRPFPTKTAVKVVTVTSGSAIAVTGIVATCKAIAAGVAAFAAANALVIGAVALCGVVAGVVVVSLGNVESGANVSTTSGNNETQQQTIININVAAGGGRVEVNK